MNTRKSQRGLCRREPGQPGPILRSANARSATVLRSAKLFRAVAPPRPSLPTPIWGRWTGQSRPQRKTSWEAAGEKYEFEQMYPTHGGHRRGRRRPPCHDVDALRDGGGEGPPCAVQQCPGGRQIRRSDLADAPIRVCPVCGHTVIGDAPDECPVCKAKGSKFQEISSVLHRMNDTACGPSPLGRGMG